MEYANGGSDLVVRDLDARYEIEVSNLQIPNSLVAAVLNFLPTEHISKTIDRFLTDAALNDVKRKAKDETLYYLHRNYGWLVWILNFEGISHNVAYGTNGRLGIVDKIVANIKGAPAYASLRTLAQEMAFGSWHYNPEWTWLTVHGRVGITYSGDGLYVLPTYHSDVYGKPRMGYQILNAKTAIDPSHLGRMSFLSNQTPSAVSDPVIPAYGLSQRLHAGFKTLFKNFLSDLAGRPYEINSNLALDPSANAGGFALDPRDPAQNVDPDSYVVGYEMGRGAPLAAANFEQTKKDVLGFGWVNEGGRFGLKPDAKRTVGRFFELSDRFAAEQSRYVTASASAYGISRTSMGLDVSESVYVGKFGLTDVTVPVTIRVSLWFEVRMLKSEIRLPYPIWDRDAGRLSAYAAADMFDMPFGFSYSI